MERRDFLKISALSGAAAALDACGNPEHQLIRFIPEEDLTPGIATWKPSVCTLCPAGCGMLVRVMQGDAEVVRKGQLGLLKMGLAKKLEGNPAHPVNEGKLCPRGQAGLQVTYHPDRIRTPLVRSGPRGSGQFKEVTWDEATKQLAGQLSALASGKQQDRLAMVVPPLRGVKKSLLGAFAAALKAPAPVEFAFLDGGVVAAADAASFGPAEPPTADLGHSNYVLSFGADFLGTWNSPVAQSLAYGRMRAGRPGKRGKLVHFEPRISLTAGNADEWIPCRPGTEGALALSLCHVILRDKLAPAADAGHAGTLIEGWAQGLPDFDPEKAEQQTGVPAATIVRIAHEAATHQPAVALAGDSATAHTSGLFNALAVNALNALLGSAGKPGGILFTPAWTPSLGKTAEKSQAGGTLPALVKRIQSGPDAVKALLLFGANPVFAAPAAMQVREALEKVPFIASFGSFIDETSILADVILPDHSPLESWLDDAPVSGTARTVAKVAAPAMEPVHNTRGTPDVLLDVAHQLGGEAATALPWKSYDEALKAAFAPLQHEKGSVSATDPDEFWSKVREQGGWWSAEEKSLPVGGGKGSGVAATAAAPAFDGGADAYAFHLLPFATQMQYDGSLAHLPWMQEAPDPLSTVMWGSWVELNPATAKKLGIEQGNLVEVASQHGSVRAPALLAPGIAPDVVAMPVGQGHESFTRYASERGANPIAILAPMTVTGTDALAWAATRVKVARVGEGKIILFGARLHEMPEDVKHR